MSIVKQVNDKIATYANKSIVDHNQLTGRNSYGAHPISAIRGLPEKITSIRGNINDLSTSISSINIQTDSSNPGQIIFTNYLGTNTNIQTSLIPDNDTIQLDSSNNLSLKKIYTDFTLSGTGLNNNELTVLGLNNDGALLSANDILTTFTNQGNFIQEVYQEVQAIEGRGGYLIPHDFDTTTPNQPTDNIILDQEGEYDPELSTLSLLTTYALSQITTITSPLDIWNGTRVTNLENNHIWILNNMYDQQTSTQVFEWIDLGQALVTVADTDTLGVVKSSNEQNYVHVDINGLMSVNGLAEQFQAISNTYIPNTRTVNNKRLNQDITLTASDVGTYTSSSIDTLLSNKQRTLSAGNFINISSSTNSDLIEVDGLTDILTDVLANNWVLDNTYQDYAYKCVINLNNLDSYISENDYAQVNFAYEEIISNNYAPICLTGDNTITIYSNVNDSITIPSILIIRTPAIAE